MLPPLIFDTKLYGNVTLVACLTIEQRILDTNAGKQLS
jgi:hypothetical protein